MTPALPLKLEDSRARDTAMDVHLAPVVAALASLSDDEPERRCR